MVAVEPEEILKKYAELKRGFLIGTLLQSQTISV